MKLADIHRILSPEQDMEQQFNQTQGNVSIKLSDDSLDDFADDSLDDFADDCSCPGDKTQEPSDDMDDDLILRMMKTSGNPDDSYGTGQVDADGQGAILSQ